MVSARLRILALAALPWLAASAAWTQTITVTAPNGGERWVVGSTHDITWTTSGYPSKPPPVGVYYSTDDGGSWISIDSFTANDGSLPWTIPAIDPTTTCRVKVQQAGEPKIYDISDKPFSIVSSAEHTVSRPETPYGPSATFVGLAGSYSTGGSVCSWGHGVRYKLSWGDGTDTGWLVQGTAAASHGWATAGNYYVYSHTCCALDNTVQASVVRPQEVAVRGQYYDSYYNAPAHLLLITEVNWSTWVSEVQITDVTGGSVVSVYFDTGTCVGCWAPYHAGPLLLWNNASGPPGSSVAFPNILARVDTLDHGPFDYNPGSGGLTLVTQDGAHLIQAAVRTMNLGGANSRTFPALADLPTNTAVKDPQDPGGERRLLIPGLSNDGIYRPSVVLYNASGFGTWARVTLLGSAGQTLTWLDTLVMSNQMVVLADRLRTRLLNGVLTDLMYSNATARVQVQSGGGRILASGQTASWTPGDPAAHMAVQEGDGFANSPQSTMYLTEVNWSTPWQSEVQVVDVTGGSVVHLWYNSGTTRRGPFELWDNSGAAPLSSVSFANILQTLAGLDPGFLYSGTSGALEMATQDAAHKIHAAVRTHNGAGRSRTFPALGLNETTTAWLSRPLLIPNISNNDSYRCSVVLYNPFPLGITTAQVTVIGNNGSQIGSTLTRALAGNQMVVLADELRGSTYSNADVRVTVTAGGYLLTTGQTAKWGFNDPAGHIAVQAEATPAAALASGLTPEFEAEGR